MAQKLPPAKIAQDEEDDLTILHPERTLTIAGVVVTVGEYSFVEGLKVRPIAAPFLKSLSQIILNKKVTLDDVVDIIAEHHEIVLQLMEMSTKQSIDWFKQLKEEEGDLLMLTWWTVNSPFFMRSVQKRMMSELVTSQLESHNAGETFIQPSSLMDTQRSV